MNVLFIHQNFPAQFIHLSTALAEDGNQVVALSLEKRPAPNGVVVRNYTLLREAAKDTHPLLREQELHVLRAEACAAAALQLKREGFTPDLIIAHPGWGEALFIKDVFPHAKLVVYCEFYYAAEGRDVGFDPEQPLLNFSQLCRLRLKNTTNLLSLEIADAGISPTLWQRSTYPEWAQKKITVIHDGIDLRNLQFNPRASLKLAAHSGGAVAEFRPGMEVISYVARNLEPVRGFHILMRTLPEVLLRRPNASVIIVGGDATGYGIQAPSGRTWKEHMLTEVGSAVDLKRVYFPGQITYPDYINLLSISRVHTYWTTPFVLSWSFLEAAASGLPVLGSDTSPVREFAAQFQVQTLDFFDCNKFANAITDRLACPIRNSLPDDISNISLINCLQRQRQWLNAIC